MTAVSRQVTDTPSVGEEGTGNAGRPRACRYTTIPSKIKSRTASHGLRCIRERRGGARGDDRACEGVVDGGAPPRAAAPGRRLAPAEVRAALRASERRAPACAGAHAACPAVRSERRAPARAAARAGCLGRRAAAGVQRAAACVQWAAAGVRQQPASARTTFTRAAWPGRAMTATRLHRAAGRGGRATACGAGGRAWRAATGAWASPSPGGGACARDGLVERRPPLQVSVAPDRARGPGPQRQWTRL